MNWYDGSSSSALVEEFLLHASTSRSKDAGVLGIGNTTMEKSQRVLPSRYGYVKTLCN